MSQDLINKFVVELRRGTVELAVMACLQKQALHGYGLLEVMQDNQINIEANTLYPLLRRLEGQGLLESTWDTSETRPKKIYQVSKQGKEVYKLLLEEYQKISNNIRNLCFKENDHE